MKKLMLICAPVTSRSGYGAHARDLVTSFLEHDKYDIKIIDVRWGDCPRNALDKSNLNDTRILNCILPQPQVDRQPDIYVDIRIPNEFETYGKFNIGITAGVETNAVSGKWIECCNKMDLIIVPSEHSKEGFVNSVYDAVQQAPDGSQQKVGELKLEKPMEVLFEGADEEIYKSLDKEELDTNIYDLIENMAPEKFAFLFVGQWTGGGYGEDRKDIGKLLKIFYETFANQKKQPALILKTNGATFSILSKEETLQKINHVKSMFPKDVKLPNVYLLHGDFTDEEMNSLYNHPKIKSMVSFTHGEGFGRPLLEATMTGLPVITSGWSGHIDFLNKDKSMLINGELEPVPKSMHWEDIIIPESKWFNINEAQARGALKHAFDNRYELKSRAKSLMYENNKKFTLNQMTKNLDKLMETHTKDLVSQVQLKLPKLKKIDNNKPKLPKIKLPKLNKVTEV
jgi:glycosyltransferase involved in cell wall biosynthesis